MTIVRGYHGTSRQAAEQILAEGFRMSQNEYDWLGRGVYFFQDSASRARSWASARFGAEGVVIGADVELDGAMDLLQQQWLDELAAAYSAFSAALELAGRELPTQTAGARRLDNAVMEFFIRLLEAKGLAIPAVRAAFEEGPPIFPGSRIRALSHVQIAVRDPARIMNVEVTT